MIDGEDLGKAVNLIIIGEALIKTGRWLKKQALKKKPKKKRPRKRRRRK